MPARRFAGDVARRALTGMGNSWAFSTDDDGEQETAIHQRPEHALPASACRCANEHTPHAWRPAQPLRMGRTTVNSLPRPSPGLVAFTVPPCDSTMSCTTARPLPLPLSTDGPLLT